jgi:multidrug efflux pump subunit AcrB
LNVQLPNPFFGQVVIVTKSLAERKRLQPQLEKILADDFPNIVGRVYPLELGPPVGWPLQYRVLGPDLERVRDVALQLSQLIAAAPDARRINFEWMEPQRQLRVKIDQDEARRLGLSSAAVATVLNTAISGTTVTQIRDDIYLVNVVARQAGGQTLSVDTLRTLQLPLPNGRSVPLNQIATFDYTQEYPLVWRRDRA